MSDDASEVAARIGDAIAQALPDDYVTRWVALVEILDPDGDRAVWTACADGMRSWDSLGLLTYGVQVEQAAIVRESDT